MRHSRWQLRVLFLFSTAVCNYDNNGRVRFQVASWHGRLGYHNTGLHHMFLRKPHKILHPSYAPNLLQHNSQNVSGHFQESPKNSIVGAFFIITYNYAILRPLFYFISSVKGIILYSFWLNVQAIGAIGLYLKCCTNKYYYYLYVK